MKTLQKVYYNPLNPAGFGGARNLQSGRRDVDVQNWLESQDAYNMHKMVRRRFNRRSYNVSEVDAVWEADLIDVRAISTYNDGYSYILVVIDVLSKYAWVAPLQSKSAKHVTEALRKILVSKGKKQRIPRVLQTDRGKEFINSHFQQLLKQHEITYRVVRNPDVKAAIVERFNRTLKERIWRYFTYSRSKRYIDVLAKIVQAYNNTKHSATRFRPCDVNKDNATIAAENLSRRYNEPLYNKHHTPKYKRGEHVRISKAKAAFVKGYESGWSKEIFKIKCVSNYRQPVVYILEDLNGEDINGFFYEEELSRVARLQEKNDQHE